MPKPLPKLHVEGYEPSPAEVEAEGAIDAMVLAAPSASQAYLDCLAVLNHLARKLPILRRVALREQAAEAGADGVPDAE